MNKYPIDMTLSVKNINQAVKMGRWSTGAIRLFFNSGNICRYRSGSFERLYDCKGLDEAELCTVSVVNYIAGEIWTYTGISFVMFF